MENQEALKIMAQQAACYPWSGAINIYVASVDMSGHATGIIWEPHVSGSFVPVLFTIDRDQAQALMDQLWDCGIRPTQGSGSAGALAAIERHLADLQKIVFSKGEITNV